MEKMLVTQALNELKTLDARIHRAISGAVFVAAAKTSEKKVNPNTTKEDFIKDAKAAQDSIRALIERRAKIKAAVIESNAKTEIEVCGMTHTIADVIDMKTSIEYWRRLLETYKTQFGRASAEMNRANVNMEMKIDQLVETTFGKESKTSIKAEDYAAIANPYRANNEVSLVDPISIAEEIKNLENFIEEFTSTVDSKLQISNCTTFIEFE